MRLFRTRSRDSSSGAWRATSSSKVAFASSIIAHSSPFISTPCCSKRAGSTRRASLPSSSRPSESARRLAGSIVSTQTFSPWAAIPAAIEAEVVFCPRRRSRRRCISPCPRGCRRASASGEPLRQPARRLGPEIGLEEEGEGLDRGLDPPAQAGQLGALGAGAGLLRERRPCRRPHRPLLARGELLQLRGLRFGEALGV